MCKYIGVEDLAANALIELIEKDPNRRKVSFDGLLSYGMAIIKIFNENNSEEAVLLLSRDYTDEAIRNYSDFFEIVREDGMDYFVLKEGKDAADLRKHFRAFLSLEMLRAFLAEETLEVLGVR